VHIAHTPYAGHAYGSSGSKVTHTVQALLAYLLLQPHRSHSREVLAGLFWGEHNQDRARSCLSTTLWRLRAILEPAGVARGTYLVTTSTGEVSFNWTSDYWLDVAAFEEQASRGLAQPIEANNPNGADGANAGVTAIKLHELKAALQLYSGEFLEGFYDDWALRERERLRALYLHILQMLMEYHQQQGTYAESVSCGKLILQCDPLREDIHRALIRLHSEHGQRALAMHQYELCCEILSVELGIIPLQETQSLYAQILHPNGSSHAVAESIAADGNGEGGPKDLQQAVYLVQAAMQGLDQARERLQRAVKCVEQFAKDM
jgi:DNA-binding SARP family transcriptional activator